MWRRLFPTLAEWPVEKWLALPVALMLLLGVVGGIFELMRPVWPQLRAWFEAGMPL